MNLGEIVTSVEAENSVLESHLADPRLMNMFEELWAMLGIPSVWYNVTPPCDADAPIIREGNYETR